VAAEGGTGTETGGGSNGPAKAAVAAVLAAAITRQVLIRW